MHYFKLKNKKKDNMQDNKARVESTKTEQIKRNEFKTTFKQVTRQFFTLISTIDMHCSTDKCVYHSLLDKNLIKFEKYTKACFQVKEKKTYKS
jgi:hypothetical protein